MSAVYTNLGPTPVASPTTSGPTEKLLLQHQQLPPTPSTPSPVPKLPFTNSREGPSSPSSSRQSASSKEGRKKTYSMFENGPKLDLSFPQRGPSHRPQGTNGSRDVETPSPDRFLRNEEQDFDQPLFSPGLHKSFTTHQPHPVQSPHMGIISSGESQRSSRASSHFGDGRDSPMSRHSSSDSGSSKRGSPKFQYSQQLENQNNPYGNIGRRHSASPASSQEGVGSRHLQAPGMGYRRSSRPTSAYSSVSDFRAGGGPGASPRLQGGRVVSGQSYDSRRSSYVDVPQHMQPPPPVLTGNSHLQGVVGANASLLSTKQTLEMYRANAKKTNDPSLQYELAVFMIGAAQQQEVLASEGGRVPNRDLDSPYVDTSAATSKAELLKEARGILERLANKLPQAQYYLADAYASGLFTNGKVENDKAFPLFVAASKHGHAEAGYRAALCYEFGWGCRADPQKAVQFYRQSASKNHPGAMTRLGKACLKDDLGLSGRYREGLKWLKRATDVADHQYPSAPYELGLLHETGYGDDIFVDLSYTAQLFTMAAELGHVDAYYRMGDAYEHGKLNCPRDAALSVHFYTGAAQGGHPLAMMALCAWYMVGAEPVLEKNEDEAYQWALKAAETGLAKAEYAVGYFTEMGIGCRRDPLEANVWYVKAADHGDQRAKDRLAVINAAASDGNTGGKKSKKSKKDKPEGRRKSEDKECRIM